MNFKTTLKFALTLAITFGLFAVSARDTHPDPNRIKYETTALNPNYQVVKAIMINGEAIPMIDLPVVEITGKANRENIVRAELIDGKVVPSILLDEITITPNS